MPTTIDNETELSAVNSILGSIGQSPLTTNSLDYTNPEITIIYNFLREANMDTQSEGWHFNTEHHVTVDKDSNNKFPLPSNVLRYDVSEGQVFRTYDVITKYDSGTAYLWDKVNHSYTFNNIDSLDLDIVYLYAFENIPMVFRRYITQRAGVKAATQLVSNSELVQLLQNQEALARAGIMEYECNQGDHSFMGWPDESAYRSYQPYRGLRRT